MREVICIHIGQAGVQIANAAWELFCVEHGIEATGKLKLNLLDDDSDAFTTFFSEIKKGQYVPRCLSVDLEPSVLDEVRKGVYRNLFNPEYLVNGIEDGCSNYARGRFSVGKRLLPSLMQSTRKLIEDCKNLQGFFIINSQGGGTGSGFTSLIMEALSEEFVKLIQYQMTVFPSPVLNVAIVEPYNSILGMKEMCNNSSVTNAFNNEAIFGICTDLLDIIHPTFSNINRVLAHLFSDITVSLRFESSLNSDLSQLGTNLIPYPRIHFITSSHSPLVSKERFEHELLNVNCIVRDLFRANHQLITASANNYVYMSCVMQFRGDINPQEINQTIIKMKSNKEIRFVEWCPTGFKLGINCQPPSYIVGSEMTSNSKSATMLMNGSIIKQSLYELQKRFDILFERRCFVQWFVGEGMEEGEFIEARDELSNILCDYEEISAEYEEPQKEELSPRRSRVSTNESKQKFSYTQKEKKKEYETDLSRNSPIKPLYDDDDIMARLQQYQ